MMNWNIQIKTHQINTVFPIPETYTARISQQPINPNQIDFLEALSFTFIHKKYGTDM